MPRASTPEVVTGMRGPRDEKQVTRVRSSEDLPPVREVYAAKDEVVYVSRFREYAVVITTEPDHVNSSGEIVRGKNKAVRFKDFMLKTSDSDVIGKLDRLGVNGRDTGLGREVWRKTVQDRALALNAIMHAEDAIDALPEDLKEEFLGKLAAKFQSFQMPKSAKLPASAQSGESANSESANP